ncbi:hypothetical protein [Neokomagataea thailandica]|uniref:Uncharacterized protein n=1 Tax=Neokomagataea tanensis NBRC 106556 TaxID=1223519 RepID=A0ABQ0QJR8_9PROT|nr:MULTISPECIES: hypothetical protein [Neokomagataea]GBR47279.1 hypothetical protein AA106556_1397 [Neokomagataea tanensis NBRC 106556]
MIFHKRAFLVPVFALLLGWPIAQADDSEVNPTVSQNDLLIARHAEDILSSEKKWNKADDRICPPSEKTFSIYCALEKSSADLNIPFSHRSAVMQQARFLIDKKFAPNNQYDHRLMDFNNDPKTDFPTVTHFLHSLEETIATILNTEKPKH